MNAFVPANQRLSHLRALEAEAMFILREVVAVMRNPCLFYSIGKDSTVLLHLARKAFFPGPLPFPLLHVDTGWEFAEMGQFRDRLAARLGLDMRVHINPDGQRLNITPFSVGSAKYTDIMKTEALKQALAQYGFDACFGGARRDEEKSRAKERVCSFRDAHQRWGPQAATARALAAVQHADQRRREPAGLPPVELDRTGHLAVHPPRRDRDRRPLPGGAAPSG